MTTKNDSNKFLFVTTMLNNPEFTQKVVKMNKSKTCMFYHHIRKLKSNGVFKWFGNNYTGSTIMDTAYLHTASRFQPDIAKSLQKFQFGGDEKIRTYWVVCPRHYIQVKNHLTLFWKLNYHRFILFFCLACMGSSY